MHKSSLIEGSKVLKHVRKGPQDIWRVLRLAPCPSLAISSKIQNFTMASHYEALEIYLNFNGLGYLRPESDIDG